MRGRKGRGVESFKNDQKSDVFLSNILIAGVRRERKAPPPCTVRERQGVAEVGWGLSAGASRLSICHVPAPLRLRMSLPLSLFLPISTQNPQQISLQ